MLKVKAYFEMGLKIMLHDKLAFIWQIIMPSIFLIMSGVENLLDLRYFWTYIIFSAYIYGVGLFILQNRESGILKMYFSIENKVRYYFISILLMQMVFIGICLFFFNCIAFILYGFNFFEMMFYSYSLMLLMIPIAFLSTIVTLMKNVNPSSIQTIVNILIFAFFVIMSKNIAINRYNPILILSQLLLFDNKMKMMYLISSVIMICIGVFSLKKFTPIPTYMR